MSYHAVGALATNIRTSEPTSTTSTPPVRPTLLSAGTQVISQALQPISTTPVAPASPVLQPVSTTPAPTPVVPTSVGPVPTTPFTASMMTAPAPAPASREKPLATMQMAPAPAEESYAPVYIETTPAPKTGGIPSWALFGGLAVGAFVLLKVLSRR